jgi:hypothetical protein
MKTLIIVMFAVSLVGCADMKYRVKNVNGDFSQAQMDKDWKDCYQYSSNRYAFEQCTKKKGYYAETYTED